MKKFGWEQFNAKEGTSAKHLYTCVMQQICKWEYGLQSSSLKLAEHHKCLHFLPASGHREGKCPPPPLNLESSYGPVKQTLRMLVSYEKST